MAQGLLHRLLLAISFDNPNGTATVTQTSFGNFFWQSQWHSDCYTDFFCQSFLTIPMAQRLLHRLLLAISFDNPNGTATVTQTSFVNLFWQSQWHSDCYTDFFWQLLLTIPMAQRLLHRLLLAISFDNPNGTATVTQTSCGNLRSSDSPIKCVAKAAPATKHGDRDSFRWRRLVQEILMLLCHRIFFTFIPGPKTQQQLTSHQGRLRFRNSFYKGVVQSKSSQTYDHLQAHYESTKSANKSSKPTKY